MPHGSNKNKTVNKVSKAFDTMSILYLDNTLSTYDKLFFLSPSRFGKNKPEQRMNESYQRDLFEPTDLT